jgi:hypothetical protein
MVREMTAEERQQREREALGEREKLRKERGINRSGSQRTTAPPVRRGFLSSHPMPDAGAPRAGWRSRTEATWPWCPSCPACAARGRAARRAASHQYSPFTQLIVTLTPKAPNPAYERQHKDRIREEWEGRRSRQQLLAPEDPCGHQRLCAPSPAGPGHAHPTRLASISRQGRWNLHQASGWVLIGCVGSRHPNATSQWGRGPSSRRLPGCAGCAVRRSRTHIDSRSDPGQLPFRPALAETERALDMVSLQHASAST